MVQEMTDMVVVVMTMGVLVEEMMIPIESKERLYVNPLYIMCIFTFGLFILTEVDMVIMTYHLNIFLITKIFRL